MLSVGKIMIARRRKVNLCRNKLGLSKAAVTLYNKVQKKHIKVMNIYEFMGVH